MPTSKNSMEMKSGNKDENNFLKIVQVIYIIHSQLLGKNYSTDLFVM